MSLQIYVKQTEKHCPIPGQSTLKIKDSTKQITLHF